MLSRKLSIAVFAAACLPIAAQRTYTAQDYANAERWMGYNTTPLVQHTITGLTYLPDGRVYFRDPSKAGTAYMIADPKSGKVSPAFDSAKVAAAINANAGQQVDATRLAVTEYAVTEAGFTVTTPRGSFRCDAEATKCTPDALAASGATGGRRQRRTAEPVNTSPDKKSVVFIRANNLWLRDLATNQERQLTTDGADSFGYATDNAGWQHSSMAIATWSADSKKIATFQMDERKTGMMYTVSVTNRHPTLDAWHYPLVGDKDVSMIQPVIIDVATGKVTRLKIDPLQHRSMECDDISCDGDGKWSDVEFSPDASRLAFVSTSRDHKDEWVKIADTATGDVRDVYTEHVPTYYGWQSKTDWKVLFDKNEFLWVSERGDAGKDFAQVYLYDLATGKLKNQITHGDGPVTDIIRVDTRNRVLYFTAVGKEKGEDLYFQNLYRVNFDGTGQKLLTPEVANHAITAAPDASSFVDIQSTIQQPQTAVLRDNNGKVLATLAKQDISALTALGWKPPTPITVKARDGVTPLEGFLFKPTNFDATKKYPVVDYVYPGPQGSACQLSGRGFSAAHGDEQSLADLGFVVVCIDGMGNPERSKTFHDAHASRPEDMGDDTIPDQVSGIKDLAAQFPWVDATKVGIWGHSGGGNATASAMLHFPDFFSVGWAESGNHDNRDYEDDWDERWAGLEVIDANGKSNYDAQAAQNYAANLKGHFMLVHGTSDDNVPPNNTLYLVQALMKANKTFDMLMVPNAHHGYADMSAYIQRRRWDYFVTWLANGIPPANYQMGSGMPQRPGTGPSIDEDDDTNQ